MSDPTWHCNACGESGEGDLFEQCWTMPLVDHGWPNSRHHWPTGKPASVDQVTFLCAMRDCWKPPTESAPASPSRTMLTLAEAAARLNLSPDTLRSQVRNKRLKATKYGNTYIVTEKEVERYERENKR